MTVSDCVECGRPGQPHPAGFRHVGDRWINLTEVLCASHAWLAEQEQREKHRD